MPACKNDASRKYKGDEPSPKGIGYCAHAEPAGKTRKGKDGRTWTVALDKNGTKSWKAAGKSAKVELTGKSAKVERLGLKVPPLVKGVAPLSISRDGNTFSDGTVLSWGIGRRPELFDNADLVSSTHPGVRWDASTYVPMTRAHWDAVVSRGDVVLRLDRGSPLPAVDVAVKGPATIGKVMLAMHKFYSTKLSAADRKALDTEMDSWSPDALKRVRTYGDSKGDHTAFAGFAARLNPFSNVYTPYWDS